MMPSVFCAERADAVLRVRLDASGLAELASAAGYDGSISAVLLDAAGNVCGRARRSSDPGVRFGPALSWHVQAGGCVESREWAGRPMGCGCGSTAWEAAAACVDDLRRRAAALSEQADRVAAMIGGGYGGRL